MFYVHKLKEGIVWVGWLKRSLNKLWMFAPQTSNGCSCQAMGVAAKHLPFWVIFIANFKEIVVKDETDYVLKDMRRI